MIKNNILYFYNFIFSYIRKIKKLKFFILFLFIYNFIVNLFQKFYLIGFKKYLFLNFSRTKVFLLAKIKTQQFKYLSISDIKKNKKSESLFIFGSGYSLNLLKNSEWKLFEKHDVLGFNHFVRQRWINVDYHLIRGWREGYTGFDVGERNSKEFIDLLKNNKFYRNTTFIVQSDFSAIFGNTLIGKKYLPKDSKIIQFKTDRLNKIPIKKMPLKLIHNNGTLCDAVSFGYNFGWKKLVLVGVDLYDTRYFWLNKDKTLFTDYSTGNRKESSFSDRGQRYNEFHSTFSSGVMEIFQDWYKTFKKDGSEIYIYNKKSLLKDILPIYK